MYRRAFTLIEMLVVLFLCSLISSFALMQLSFLDDTMVRIEMDKLLGACLYMQQLAIATNKEQYLFFDMQTNGYRFATFNEKLSPKVRFGVLPGIKGSPGNPTFAVGQAITFPGRRVCFYPTGTISSGTVYLTDTRKKSLYALSNAVSQVSYLRMYRYDGTWKLYGDHKK